MKYIGWDIEIEKDVQEGTNWKNIRPLGITCASAVADDFVEPWWGGKSESKYNSRMSPKECLEMMLFLKSKTPEYTIVTWNGLAFDFDVAAEECLNKQLGIEMALNHMDIMYQFFCQNGFPVGIDAVCKGSGLPSKIEGMHGDLAPQMWRDGRYQEVIDYNIQDSRMALNVSNFIEAKHGLYWITKKGINKYKYIGNLLKVKDCSNIILPDQSWMTNPMSKEDYLNWTI